MNGSLDGWMDGEKEGWTKNEGRIKEASHNSRHVIVVDSWMDKDMEGCKKEGIKEGQGN